MLRLNGIKSLTVEARSNVLQAAGYTTRRYVKLLRRIVEEPFSVCPARSSRRQEGVLLQGHPRPWPVAKPRTLWVPAHKVQFRIGVVLVRGWYPAGEVGAARVSCHLHALPLWTKRPRQGRALIVVAPVLGRSAAKDQAVGRAASLVFVVSTPRYGFAVFIYTCPLFLHTSAVVNHAGSVPGVQGAAVPAAGAENVGQRFRRIVAAKTDSLVGTQSRLRFCPSSTAPVGTVFPGLRPRALSLRFSVVTGPVGPDPGGRLCPHTAGLCRRPGAWGLPSVVPSKPAIPYAQMLQTASGATLHSLRSFRAIGGL